MTIYEEIAAERATQDAKWGGPSHDDNHTSHDWIAYLSRHVGRAVEWPWSQVNFRRQMVRVAALAVAAIEWCDRNEDQANQDAFVAMGGSDR